MLDLLIRGDRIVTSTGAGAYDVAIQGEKIVAVAAAGTFDTANVPRLLDGTGKIVIPGGVDPHVHCAWFAPQPDGTILHTEPASVSSRAALFGGTTTMIDFARWMPGTTIEQSIEQRLKDDWVGKCYCDYSFH